MASVCLSMVAHCIWCIWVIDWKMKVEAGRFRKASTHHYEKRGIGWHGIMIVHYTYKAPWGKKGLKHTQFATKSPLTKSSEMATSKMVSQSCRIWKQRWRKSHARYPT